MKILNIFFAYFIYCVLFMITVYIDSGMENSFGLGVAFMLIWSLFAPFNILFLVMADISELYRNILNSRRAILFECLLNIGLVMLLGHIQSQIPYNSPWHLPYSLFFVSIYASLWAILLLWSYLGGHNNRKRNHLARYHITYLCILLLTITHASITLSLLDKDLSRETTCNYMMTILVGYIVIDAFLSWLLHGVYINMQGHSSQNTFLLWMTRYIYKGLLRVGIQNLSAKSFRLIEFSICGLYLLFLPIDSTVIHWEICISFLPVLIPKTCKLLYEINKNE